MPSARKWGSGPLDRRRQRVHGGEDAHVVAGAAAVEATTTGVWLHVAGASVAACPPTACPPPSPCSAWATWQHAIICATLLTSSSMAWLPLITWWPCTQQPHQAARRASVLPLSRVAKEGEVGSVSGCPWGCGEGPAKVNRISATSCTQNHAAAPASLAIPFLIFV